MRIYKIVDNIIDARRVVQDLHEGKYNVSLRKSQAGTWIIYSDKPFPTLVKNDFPDNALDEF